MADTSLIIAEIPVGRRGGVLGLSIAPGKCGPSTYGGSHRRDLAADMDRVRDWGAAAVVTLMEAHELARFSIASIGEEAAVRFMEWHHLPIVDVSVPCPRFEAAWPEASARLRALLESGQRVFVHCRGGLGRSGMVSARLLVEMGAGPDEAIRAVRRARSPQAIETRAQEAWVARGAPAPLLAWGDDAKDRALGALVGLAVGDAVGTTLEFTKKPERPVLSDMVGGGPFRLRPGEFTDDTAMALALADSLTTDGNLQPADLMDRFVDWWRNGTYSCTGRCFDIGNTTAAALSRYERTGDPLSGSTDAHAAGNGSIMRLAPVAVRHWSDRETLLRVARLQSQTTHASEECVASSMLLAEILADAIAGAPLPHVVAGEAALSVRGYRPGQPREEVHGTGYVVASLHAALWAVARTTSFESAVLMAANLGQDADTTGAIAGQIAGALYGLSGIPDRWLDRLAWRARITGMAEALFEAGAPDPAALRSKQGPLFPATR